MSLSCCSILFAPPTISAPAVLMPSKFALNMSLRFPFRSAAEPARQAVHCLRRCIVGCGVRGLGLAQVLLETVQGVDDAGGLLPPLAHHVGECCRPGALPLRADARQA